VALILVFVLIASNSFAATHNAKTNEAIKTVLMNWLETHGVTKNANIQVQVENDTIFLSGVVSTIAQEKTAVDDANRLGEGYIVVDDLTIQPTYVENEVLFDSVAAAIHKNVFYSIFDWIMIRADTGVVTLSGWVYEPWHRNQFIHAAEKVPGIKKLVDSIKILPVSFLDDNIRHRAADLIYDSPMFEQYTYEFYPPIHIIVDDGVVSLYGTAATETEKAWITNQIAVNTQAFKVYNYLQVPQT